MERKYVTVKEALQVLGILRTTLYELIRTGEMPVRRFRGAVRIPVEALQWHQPAA